MRKMIIVMSGENMKLIDNRLEKLGDDLKKVIVPNSKIQMCASIFSMYGYESLKKELNEIDELKSRYVFLENSRDSLEGHIRRLESCIRRSSNLDQTKRIIEDYHREKEIIFYTISLVRLEVKIQGSSLDSNVHNAHYFWTIDGKAVKPIIKDYILNDGRQKFQFQKESCYLAIVW